VAIRYVYFKYVMFDVCRPAEMAGVLVPVCRGEDDVFISI